MNQLQKVLDTLHHHQTKHQNFDTFTEAIAIIKQMMQEDALRSENLALRQQLAEAQALIESSRKQEPVAWLVEFENGEQELHFDDTKESLGESQTPLYAAPQAVPVQAVPVAWRVWSPDGTNVYQYREDGDGEPLFAAPTSKTQKGLFVDLIAQHPGLAEELKAIDEAPMPTWTPPRLTDEDMDALWRSVDYKVAYDKFRLDLARTIETAVRFQFGIND